MGKRGTNYTQSRGLRLLPYQEKIIDDCMAIENLSRSGAIRFLLMLGAHAHLQEDRLSQKLDKLQASVDVIGDLVNDIHMEECA